MKRLQETVCPFSIEEELDFSEKFTRTYQENHSQDISTCEAACLAVQFPACMCPPQDGDMFVGRYYSSLVQFSPQPGFMDMGYCMDHDKWDRWQKSGQLNRQQEETCRRLSEFWQENGTKYFITSHYPPNVLQWLPYENYFQDRAVAHPLYRMSATHLDYLKLLTLGVDGLHQQIRKKQQYAALEENNFYQALHSVLDTFSRICESYVDEIERLLSQADLNSSWREELLETKRSLLQIAHAPALHFRDALQMVYLWWIYSGSLNFGRMDTYLSEFYVNDLSSGFLTQERALELMCGFWQMIELKNRVYDSRIVLGGKGRKNETNCDQFCLLAIDTIRKMRTTAPQVALRFYHGMDETVYDAAFTAIGEGCTFPMLYNDDVNIPAVSHAFGVSEEIAEHYCPYGCGEYVLEHQSIGTPSGIINLAKALEVTLYHGKDLETEEVLGLDLGGLETYQTFEELLSAYQRQVEHFVSALAKMEELEYIYSGRHCAFLCFSMLFDDCISRGRPLLDGGVRYLGGTLESYGNVNTADSLTAIKLAVYDKKIISSENLLQALRDNFSSNPNLRRILTNLPKYGNEDETADSMLVTVHDHICDTIKESVKNTIMHSYLAVIINNDANTVLGHLTAATPDGRGSGAPLANANNPQGGADRSGLTAMLHSIVKPSIQNHAGSVQNLKLNKEMFSENMIAKTKALLSVYFQNGGSQIMITVVSRDEMEDAVIHPERHQDLIVRVGGFSARFIELGKDVQQELLSRTLHG